MRKPLRKSLLSILTRLAAEPAAQRPVRSASAFQAVSILGGVRVCDAARQLGAKRFLVKHAPSLPLAGCTMRNQCQCRYLKHHDRRTDPRRLSDAGLRVMMFDGKERRFRKGRRSTD
ncbi:MAG TPA: hypothetical protein VHK24_14490 [Steroidobacter sp.]|jgi:hypothetical protein|nr:hypothetical protein [Steroidobacter sp.]